MAPDFSFDIHRGTKGVSSFSIMENMFQIMYHLHELVQYECSMSTFKRLLKMRNVQIMYLCQTLDSLSLEVLASKSISE